MAARQNAAATAEATYWLIALEEAPEDAALRARFTARLAERPTHAEAGPTPPRSMP